MKKIILLLIFCSSLLISQEIDKTGEGFSVGVKIEMGAVYKSLEGEKVWQLAGGINFPLRYTFNTQWAAEINPGLTPISAYSLTMGMRCYYFPFRNEYDKNNFFVFLGLDNAFCSKKFLEINEHEWGKPSMSESYHYKEKTNGDYIYDTPIVSLLFGTGIQFRESYAFDLSVSIPFNSQYATGTFKCGYKQMATEGEFNSQYATGTFHKTDVPDDITYPIKMHVLARLGFTWFF